MSAQRFGAGRFWFGLLVLVVISIVLIGGTGGDGTPYDPQSVQPNGVKGLVDVLNDLGADVSIDQAVPDSEVDAAIVLRDRLSVDDRNDLLSWVGDGGVLVVADPFSPLHAPEGQILTSDRLEVYDAETCTIDRLAGAEELEVSFALELRVDRRDDSCFGDGQWAQIVETSAGDGSFVFTGGQQLFTNERLDEKDAAVIAVNVLTAEPQGASIAVIAPSVIASDQQKTVTELLGIRVRNSVFMAAFAFLLYAFYRGRRLGSVVEEPLPIPIRGSELVLRHGHLEHRSNDPGAAAEVLRAEFVRRMASALRVSADPTFVGEDRLVALRTELRSNGELTSRFSAAELDQALLAPVDNDEQLVSVAQQLSRIDIAILRPELEDPSSDDDPVAEDDPANEDDPVNEQAMSATGGSNLADATKRERLP